MRSARRMVDSRWAMISAVRSRMQGFETLLNEGFGLGIDRARGFVENQHFGIGGHRPGEGDQLALAGAELTASFADPGRPAVPVAVDDRRGLGPFGRQHSIASRVTIGMAKADVLFDRAVEQVGVLKDDGEPAAKVVERHLPNVDAVIGDRTFVGIVKAGEQLHDR